MDEHPLKIALIGNPNCGKTTLFNLLTGKNQVVGNWPGVTVERKEGFVLQAPCPMLAVDLPGIYALSPYSMEERIAAEYLLAERPDAVINVVDATNPERNLYLSLQVLETGIPTVLALNMMDAAEARGDQIRCDRISKMLGGVPVCAISARTGAGRDRLLDAVSREVSIRRKPPLYDGVTEAACGALENLLMPYVREARFSLRFTAMKLLAGESPFPDMTLPDTLRAQLRAVSKQYAENFTAEDPEIAVADARYRLIEEIAKKAVFRNPVRTVTRSEKIDRIVLNRFLAFPVFLLIVAAVFFFTFVFPGRFLQQLTEQFLFGTVTKAVSAALLQAQAPVWLIRLTVDGVLGGVGGVLLFLPQIFILFTLLSFLEDSGYMARIAFLMDPPMRKIGLSGKAFIPLLMGFGCSVPAVMAARTMETVREKQMTVFLIPFASCSAKLPVYIFFAGAFFPEHPGLVVSALYGLSVLLGVLAGFFLKRTAFRDNAAPFVLELPPYRMPSFFGVFRRSGEKIRHFLTRAATLIFAMSVFLWFLQSFDFRLYCVSDSRESMLGVLGGTLAPLFKPVGFGSWQAVVAVLTGLVAKEAVLSSLCLFCGVSGTGGVGAAEALSAIFPGKSAAFAFLTFILLYAPCAAAVSTMRRELGSARLTGRMLLAQWSVAYGCAFLVYQLGNLF